MPPKVAKADVADSHETAKANRVMDDELKLTWALISQMSAGGKLVGVNWEEVQAQIEAPTKHAAYLRWDALKKRMAKRGFELPKDRAAPEAKAKVTKSKATGVKAPRGKKVKEDAEAAAQAEAQVNGGEISGSGDEEMKDDDAEVKAEVAKPKANGAKKPSGKKAKDTAVQEDDAQVSGGEGAGSVVDEEMKDDAAEVKATKSKPKVTKPKVTKPKVTKSKVTKPKAPRGKKAKELAEAAAASEAATQEEEEKAEISGGEGAGSGEEVQDHDANGELTSSAPEVAAEEDACA